MWKNYKIAEKLINAGSSTNAFLDPISYANLKYGDATIDEHPAVQSLFKAMSEFSRKHIVYARDPQHLADILANQVSQFEDYKVFATPEFKPALASLFDFFSKAYFNSNPSKLALSLAFDLFLVYFAASVKLSQSSISFSDKNGIEQIAYSPYSLIGFKPDVYAIDQKFYQINNQHDWFDFLNIFVSAIDYVAANNSNYKQMELDFGMAKLLSIFESNADFYDSRKVSEKSPYFHENIIFENSASNARFSDFCKKFTFIIQELQKVNFNTNSLSLI